MNVEVLRLRAVAGKDAGALARFAEAAASEQATVAEMTAALVALARPPRAGLADVAATTTHVARLVGPTLQHDRVRLALAPGDASAPTAAPALAVRLAVWLALEAAADHARAGSSGNTSGAAGDDRSGTLRCTVRAGDEPTLEVAPAPAGWPGDALGELADAGVRFARSGDGVRLVFPAP